MFFLADSELCHVYKGPKSKKLYGTFGLGWKYKGRTVSGQDGKQGRHNFPKTEGAKHWEWSDLSCFGDEISGKIGKILEKLGGRPPPSSPALTPLNLVTEGAARLYKVKIGGLIKNLTFWFNPYILLFLLRRASTLKGFFFRPPTWTSCSFAVPWATRRYNVLYKSSKQGAIWFR